MKKQLILLFALLVSTTTLWAWSGTGTEGDPYLIKSASDWNTLATNVNSGTTYSGVYFKQTANITVSTMVGSSTAKFSGIYNGDGHTITSSISNSNSYAAPFCFIDGATIKNLAVAGSVNGGIHCAAVVGGASGTNTISNVIATAAVTCSSTHCGGILGHGGKSTTTLEGCVFAGSISATGTSSIGALWGWSDGGSTPTIKNCLEAGTYSNATNFNPVGMCSSWGTVTNTYYKKARVVYTTTTRYDNNRGKQAYTITAGDGVTVANAGEATAYSVSGITSYGTGIKYNDILYAGNGENVSLNLSGSSTGNYKTTTGTLSGSGNPFTLTMAAANTTVNDDATYSPTTIVNGDFSSQPWMDYVYNSTTYTINSSGKPGKNTVVAPIPKGVGGGWNTSDNTIAYTGNTLFEWSSNMGTYNPTLNTNGNNNGHGSFIEMNAENAAVFSQDLATYGNDVIRWTLQHAVRTTSGAPSPQAMEVEIGAPNRDGEDNIVATSGTGEAVNAQIQESTKAVYLASGCSGYNGYGDVSENLEYLSLTTSQATQWYTVTGVYTVPDGQSVTRFAFISRNASSPSVGNLLDNLTFSTLIGNLSAVQNSDGSVSLQGYWGETDTSKKLMVKIGDETKAIDMTSMVEENFIITIPKSDIGNAAQLEVYHQDYEAAKRTLNIVYNVTAHQDPQNPSNYYSTFYVGLRKYLLPENVEAYVGTVNNETNNLTLTKIADAGQTIPANNAVILKSATDSYSLSVSSNDPVSFDVTNNLRGVDETTTIVGSAYEDKVIYTLAAENSTLGFYKYYQQNSVPANEETRNSRTLAANKAFLPLDEAIAAGARGFVFQFDETTSLTPVPSPKGEGSIYFNLNGQRVNKPAKGLYIKDGKKVVVR